ncbi:hypothetical protein CBR_g8437 [Chara braunii]|uniref:Integrase zinc-binding domain-containing protein n=1 Tax=Chara braunii TaxID=69332 RepID=A0A388KM56_CHABU|nr:hypothetical protein CBR_g8437 [Chara braunii]|eukprot:GBG71136.1 hypothetical protein CBR_g8437 [Chara braunii]
MARRRTFLEGCPLGIEPPRDVDGRIETSLPTANEGWHPMVDWVGVELVENMVYLVTRVEWRADENGEWNPDPRGHMRVEGQLYVSEDGWQEFGVRLASGEDPLSMFEAAWQLVWRAGFEFADPGGDNVTADLKVAMVGSFELPSANVRMRLPPFLLGRLGGLELVRRAVADLANLTYEDAMVHREYYRAFLEMGPFSGEQRLGKGMATEEGINDQQSGGNQGTNGDGERNEGSARDRESAKPEGTRQDGKDLSIGESLGKAGGSKRGPQENREGGNDMRTSPRNSAGTTPRKTKISDARPKLAEIEKRTVEFKARLIEQMMAGDKEEPQGAGSREGRRTGQDEARYGGKDNSHKGTPNKKGKDKDDPPAEGTENAMTPPAIDSGTSRLPATSKVTGACNELWSLRERVLGWFHLEGTPKTSEKQRESKEGEGTSAAGEAGSSEGGLKRIVATLTRALNKNQGYLADAKKKLTFDGANITEFLIDYENLAALLKWTEEEKMDHLGQHVSLSLGRDIMAIVASSGSWKETRNEMTRKYLKAEKMATEAELAAVQRKNYVTYNNFLRAFTLVALRIPGVTDRIMSKYFLRQFSEFDKDKILSAYQQTSKFEYTRDVDFSTVTDLAEKTVVTETLTLLKEGEVIDLTGKTGDKRCSRSLKGEILGPQGERVNWNSPGGMRRVVILLNNLDIAVVEAESVAGLVWDQPRGRGPQVNFILEGNGQDRVNITTRRAGAEKKLIRDTVMEEATGARADQEEAEAGEQEKVYGKTREEEPVDKATAAKKKFRYQIPILTLPELDDTLSKLLGTMVSVSFQTMLQASPRLLKGLRQLLTQMIGMHLHDGTYMVDIEDPVTGRGELLRLLGTGGDPPKGKLATWSPTFEESARKGAFARMEGMREMVEIMIEEVFSKKEWIKMGLPLKKRRQEDEVLGVMLAEKESEIELGASLPKPKEGRKETTVVVLEIPDLLQLIKAIRYHKVGVDPTAVARFEEEIQKGYCLNGKVVSLQPRAMEVARPIPIAHFLGERSQKGVCESTNPRFILRIDPTNVAGDLKNYKPIDPTVGRWIGFIWQFDYKVKRIAGLRNRADGLSRVCIMLEGVEDAEPIDAFLEYEGGAFVVDNEMTDSTLTTGQLLIHTLEKGAPAELREGPVTTVRRKEEKDSWGAEVGAREKLMAMAVEGGRDAVMTLAKTWAQKECQYLVNQSREEQDADQKEQEFFLIQIYEGIFREIGLLLVGNKQPTEVSSKAREEAEKYVLRNGHLLKKEEGMIPRRVICGRSRQLDVIQAMHDGLAGGHRSSKGTLAKIVPLYFWPGMAGMVATYCQTCLICPERSSARVYEPFRPTRVLGPGHLVHLNLAVMPVSTDGFRYILDARDNLSGYVEVVALKRKTGKAVADWVEDYLRHPFVCRFIADNGTRFVNQEVLNRLKILTRQGENSKMEFGNKNDSNAINTPTGGQPSRQAGESSSRKRKLYVEFDHNLAVNRGGRKQGTRGLSPLREGEPIVLPSESDTSSEEEGNPGKRQRLEEEEPIEVIDLSSEEEEDEVTTPTREERGREEGPEEEKDKWIEEFGPTLSDWFNQWAAILRYQWAMKGKEKLSRGEDLSPTTFFSEGTLLQLQGIKRQMQQEMDDRARREARRGAAGQ